MTSYSGEHLKHSPTLMEGGRRGKKWREEGGIEGRRE